MVQRRELQIQRPGPSDSEIGAAFVKLWELIKDTNEHLDVEYFLTHRNRYRRCIKRICTLCPSGARVLDVGSHYLHQVGVLKLLGFDVLGMDVPEFSELSFVRNRARELQVENITVAKLESGQFCAEKESVDCVLFCEILEHITFNPIDFWKRIYNILSLGGVIYITTPNSLRFVNLVSTIKRALTLSGVGLQVSAIFSNVTYGHHWKEYSASEIRRYFARLSPDFLVRVNYYAYEPDNMLRQSSSHGLKSIVRQCVRIVGNRSHILADQLEVVVRLEDRTLWLSEPPLYQ